MAMDFRPQQQLKMSQQLRFTMEMQQAIKLLQLSHQELVAQVQRELVENPALEEIPGSISREMSRVEEKIREGVAAQSNDVVEQNNGSSSNDMDWARLLEERAATASTFQASAGPSRYDDLPPIEQSLSNSDSLADHLLWQLSMASCTDPERRAAMAIIHNLDQRGWLQATLEEIADESDADPESVEGGLEIVQGFDPLGCGGRDLSEVLVLQARVRWPEDPNFVTILTDHLGDLETHNHAAIARALDLELEDVIEYHKMIQTMEPWPGRPYSDEDNGYITPDVEVVKRGDKWVIQQNDDGLPRLRVSGYYKRVLEGGRSTREERQYIKDKIGAADFLIASIFKRQRTIHKVVQAIIDRQPDFFDQGTEALRPMVLRDIADEIGVHESTVSRVTTNKYVQTPHGIFELKFFFNAAIQRTNGDDLAGEAVKLRIKRLVGDENVKKPLSDSEIVKLLARDNIQIARRTVAKYREQMGILSSSQRKRVF